MLASPSISPFGSNKEIFKKPNFQAPKSHQSRSLSGFFRSKQDNCEYLFNEFSFIIFKSGLQYECTEFDFNPSSRQLLANVHIWSFDIVFSKDFTYLESGTCLNRTTLQTWSYGTGLDQLNYTRVDENDGKNCINELEPALYHVDDDHVAFIFSTYSLVVIMEGKVYNSTSFQFNAKTRHVVAKVHKWMFDFYFSEDYSYVESGEYRNDRDQAWKFGLNSGELFFLKIQDGKFILLLQYMYLKHVCMLYIVLQITYL